MTPEHRLNDRRLPKGIGILFKPGLGRSLVLWFLLLALLPLTVVSLISLEHSGTILRNDAFRITQLQTRLLGERIDNYFRRMILDLALETNRHDHLVFVQSLNNALLDSGQDAHEFVGSRQWTQLVDQYGDGLTTLRRTYKYQNVYLISTRGDILYSVVENNDLGTNLFTGMYADSRFAAAARRSFSSGKATFSDLELFEPSGTQPTGFLISPLVDEGGNKAGLLAFQFSSRQIESIMASSRAVLQNGDIYLLGPDRTLRSRQSRKHVGDFLKTVIDTRQAHYWHELNVQKKLRVDDPDIAAMVYQGPHGKEVLGSHYTVFILDVPWAVIAEVEADAAFAAMHHQRAIHLSLLSGTFIVVVVFALILANRIVRPIHDLSDTTRHVAAGELEHQIPVSGNNEIGELAVDFNAMLKSLRQARANRQENDWSKTAIADLNERTRGNQSIAELGDNLLISLAQTLSAGVGVVYVLGEDGLLHRVAGYAFSQDTDYGGTIAMGERLVGQVAEEGKQRLVDYISDDYLVVSSGLGKTPPKQIVLQPLVYDQITCGVVELGTLDQFTEAHLQLLEHAAEVLGVAVTAAQGRERTQELLRRSQAQSEELQSQADELQQKEEEMRILNEELEEQNLVLQEEKRQQRLTQQALEMKAKQLSLASKYKSEFLANMSHELRTPLNSLLLLSKSLADNRDGNLNDSQVESARVIHHSGTDLLGLINDILDLSKIEAGRVELELGDVRISDLAISAERAFSHQAEHKGIAFEVQTETGVPETIQSDHKRVEQVIRNLLSNAIKFTQQGKVLLTFGLPVAGPMPDNSVSSSGYALQIAVSDTGIGIPLDKQRAIFEAFQQVDGSTARKFGGTGLGLSISRQLATLLGGEIHLQSEPDKGSTFTLYLPDKAPLAGQRSALPTQTHATPGPIVTAADSSQEPIVADDRADLAELDKVILVIEDDAAFTKSLINHCHQRGFKCLSAGSGEAGIDIARHYHPMGIVLDLRLPGIDGWQVLKKLKADKQTRYIPVHIVSVMDPTPKAQRMGAIGFLHKPVTPEQIDQILLDLDNISHRSVSRILVVEDDQASRNAIADLFVADTIEVKAVASAAAATEALRDSQFDCMVLDLGLPDKQGMVLLQELHEAGDRVVPPVVVYTGQDLNREDELELRNYSDAIILKDARSEERLLDEVSLFLHRVLVDDSSPDGEPAQGFLTNSEKLKGKKVLIVDDDLRTLFALSKLLYEEDMVPLKANGGEQALDLLKENPDVDLVLTDIMMPDMDGYQLIDNIRALGEHDKLPIVALTAKAMKGDRERCLDAGANDYLAKPVEPYRLFSLLQVWLSR
jgi:signal transduction histidine kinase/DNA-binding response OmpR family regulator/HAMP domain-containing protein